jgi:hypothetical protein
MDEQERILVGLWRDSPPPQTSPSDSAMIRWEVIVASGVATLFLHVVAMIVLGITLGDFGKSSFPTSLSASRNQIRNADPLMLIPFVAPDRSKTVVLEGVKRLIVLPANMPIALPSPLPLESERLALNDEDVTPLQDGSDNELAAAEEIYVRQIRARIERGWAFATLPATTDESRIDGGGRSYQCQAQLEQDERGNVLLPNCSGPYEWKQSLLLAIRQASPLPAPPDPRVFRNSIVLHFLAIKR